MEIDKQDLLKIIDIIRGDLAEKLEDKISLDADYYLEIPPDIRFDINNITNPDKKIGVGQLYDDWSDLLTLKNDPDCIINYHVSLLAPILYSLRQVLFRYKPWEVREI